MRISAVTLALLLLCGCSDNPSQQTATGKTLVQPLTASGEIVSLETASISPPSVRGMWQMKVQFLVPENTHVKAGDMLVKFDGQQLQTRLIEQQSSLAAEKKNFEKQQLENEAKAEELKLALAEAQMNYDKEKRLAEIVDISTKRVEKEKQRKEFAIATAKLAQATQEAAQFTQTRALNDQLAQSKIKRLQSKLSETQRNIAKLSVTAPKAGLIMYKADFDGEKVAVGDTVFMGRTLLTIPSLDKLAVKAQFDEADTAKLSIGSTVKVTLDAYPEVPYSGKIISLGEAYKEKSSTNLSIVFDVEIELDRIDAERMRPGMKANVEVQKDALS
ncbi:HlyD family secretion protein [Alteromonas gilva]|uniref:Efflux RND transporter periplasmic adaptor subunit n=1 Tax=Alteromonas gilva TaxID=2987522 RepID=A0ABT5L6U5_9ALTE|nr:efflux RND transporter periplasmic adaptor subunit [Alteromonas gilva]MDC8831547.1 efflux RND transporter periplasmic adaptor subunit [Alteromonas gilva]